MPLLPSQPTPKKPGKVPPQSGAAAPPPPYSQRAAALAKDILAHRVHNYGRKERQDNKSELFNLPFAQLAVVVQWLVVEGRSYATTARDCQALLGFKIPGYALGKWWSRYVSAALLREAGISEAAASARIDIHIGPGSRQPVQVIIYQSAGTPAPRVQVVEK